MLRTGHYVARLCSFVVVGMLAGTATAAAAPISFTFAGTLADGGWFTGSLTYGMEDQDALVDGLGRYLGLDWDVDVRGGSVTVDSQLRTVPLGLGRALVETSAPRPLQGLLHPVIGLVFLGPTDPLTGTESQGLSPHFVAQASYDPDVQPTLDDFGALMLGQIDPPRFGVYRDGFGGITLVDSFQFNPVPEPGLLALLGLGASALALRRRPRRRG